MITRVLVAHDAGARLFENRGPRSGLHQLESIDFEDGRRHEGEIESDRAGRSAGGPGTASSAYESHQSGRAHAIELFAKELVHDLERAFDSHSFHHLVLIAPPRLLGTLREALPKKMVKCVVGSIAKDLPRATNKELIGYLEPYVIC